MYIPQQSNWASLNKHPYAKTIKMEKVNSITMKDFIIDRKIPL